MNEYSCSFTLNHPMTQEDFDKIIDAELDSTPTMTFRTKSGKEVEYTKVVRCKDCKHWCTDSTPCLQDADAHFCAMVDFYSTSDWFCAYGERKEV